MINRHSPPSGSTSSLSALLATIETLTSNDASSEHLYASVASLGFLKVLHLTANHWRAKPAEYNSFVLLAVSFFCVNQLWPSQLASQAAPPTDHLKSNVVVASPRQCGKETLKIQRRSYDLIGQRLWLSSWRGTSKCASTAQTARRKAESSNCSQWCCRQASPLLPW